MLEFIVQIIIITVIFLISGIVDFLQWGIIVGATLSIIFTGYITVKKHFLVKDYKNKYDRHHINVYYFTRILIGFLVSVIIFFTGEYIVSATILIVARPIFIISDIIDVSF